MGSGSQVPDIDGLRNFAERTERQPALFFAGRGAIIEQIERSCAASLDEARRGKATVGATFLLQGPPGAGKSAILWEILRRWKELKRKSPAVVKLRYNELNNEALVTEMIAEAARKGASERFRESLERQFSPGAKFGTWELAVHRGRKTFVAARETTLGALSRLPKGMWNRPVCVVVDEIQKVGPEAKAVLNALEDGIPGVPVVSVYAGLSNSRSVLESAEIGLSSISSEHLKAVGCLEEGEAGRVVEMFLEGYGVRRTAGESREWEKRVESLCERWPQHLHKTLQALATEIADVNGILADVDKEKVMSAAQAAISKAQSLRRTNAMKAAPLLTAWVLEATRRKRLKLSDVLERIDEISERGGKEGARAARLPDGISAEKFLDDHLVRKGALQEGGDGTHFCPIPCFQRFLMREGGLKEETRPSGGEG